MTEDQRHLAPASACLSGKPAGGPRCVLFLFSDTGGGHRRAAEAVVEALTARYPGSFRTVLCDPLLGADAAPALRSLARLYGPAVRWVPWAWGAAYYVSNSRAAMAVLSRTAFAPAARTAAHEAATSRPDVVVSCHPLTSRAAATAARRGTADPVPVVTLVTDLAAVHASWLQPGPDLLAVPSAAARAAGIAAGLPAGRCPDVGLPVPAAARAAAPAAGERAALRRSLGLPPGCFIVLLAGGAEGCGGLARRTGAILRRFPDVHVVTACGRNARLQRRLSERAGRAAGRLTVLGFTGDFADWLRCADVVVTKAGPGVITEAASCGAPLLLTSHLPGQEKGNAALVARAGAGRSARGLRGLLAELAAMRSDPAMLAAMRAGGRNLARPDAAKRVADLIARLAGEAGEGGAMLAGVAAADRPLAAAEPVATEIRR